VPYIHDVIGDLRTKHLIVLRRINEVRLAMHLLEKRLDRLDGLGVSRETYEEISDGDA